MGPEEIEIGLRVLENPDEADDTGIIAVELGMGRLLQQLLDGPLDVDGRLQSVLPADSFLLRDND